MEVRKQAKDVKMQLAQQYMRAPKLNDVCQHLTEDKEPTSNPGYYDLQFWKQRIEDVKNIYLKNQQERTDMETSIDDISKKITKMLQEIRSLSHKVKEEHTQAQIKERMRIIRSKGSLGYKEM